MRLTELTKEESRVIREKQTEAPFSGEYWNLYEEGIFICRQCGLPLFNAKAKFDSNCGWPSFDATFPYAVKELLDADGERTEILCSRCGGHLGHVFRGEKLTEKDTRHCANSLSIKFVPKAEVDEYMNKLEARLEPVEIVLGGGCFWCIEAAFLRLPGILNAVSGYSGGTMDSPTYEQVCSGDTGHIEVVKLVYDAKTLSLKKILDTFFMIHDPTSVDQQGNDKGTQYRSVIYYNSDKEKDAILEYITAAQQSYKKPIVTKVEPLKTFYKAEEYHQRYFEKNPFGGYCQAVVRPKVEKVEKSVHEIGVI